MSPQKRISMLRVKTCSDPHRWYARLEGQLVPDLGYDPVSGWKSKERAGYTNYILSQDAERIEAFAPVRLLGQWPYITHETLAKPAATTQPKACAASCNTMGICQALEDCQDQHRINAQMAKPAPAAPTKAGQSRSHSVAEALANIVVGFAVSVAITAVLLPAFGHQISLQDNLAMTAVFTVASLLRSYALRRVFNSIAHQSSKG